MGRDEEALAVWDERLRLAEEELREREQRVLADDPSPGEMLALAAERDKRRHREGPVLDPAGGWSSVP